MPSDLHTLAERLLQEGSVVAADLAEVDLNQLIQELHRYHTQQVRLRMSEASQREADFARLIHELRERVKELKALHAAAVLLREEQLSVEEVLERFVALLPPSMQYPEITSACVCLGNFKRATANDRETAWQLTSEFTTANGTVGRVRVCYLEPRPPADLGPFLQEEQNLVEALAEMLRVFFDRRHAFSELHQSETQLRLLFDHNPHSMWIYDPETLRFLAVNDTAVERYGYSREEFLAMTIADIRPEEDVPALRRALAENSGFRTYTNRPWRHRLKNGEIIWVEIASQEISFQGRQARLVLAVDVTQIRQAYDQLAEKQGLLRMASLISKVGGWSVTVPELKVTWSDEIRAVHEVDSSYVPTVEKAISFYAPKYQEIICKVFFRCVEEGTPFDVECEFITAKGRLIWVRAIGEAVLDATGQIRAVQGAFQEITEQKNIQESLRVSEERFRLLSRATHDAIWDWNLLTNELWWGEGYESLFGYNRNELEPTIDSWTKHIHPEDHERVVTKIYQAIQSDALFWSDEYRYRRKNGQYAFVLDRGYIIREESGRAVRMIGSINDLTDRKQLESQLIQSQKMEAIGQLAGGVAHDFNNLLTIINGYSEMVLAMLPVASELRGMLTEIRDAGDRAANLTRQLLAFSRKQMLSPRIVDLNTIVANIEKMLRRLIGEDIRLLTILAPQLPSIRVDPGQLEQVIINLAVNARDAMPQGGRLTMETTRLEIRSEQVSRYHDVKPGSYVALIVSDTGCGMPPEVLNRIFEPFFTTKEVGKGTGLGLATVFGIVKQSDGYIDVTSEVGVGTRFQIMFPVAATEEKRGSQHEGRLLRGSETILLVEDEPGVRGITRVVLESHGYKILEAANGRHAQELFRRHRDEVRLLLTDVVMPEMSGRQLVEQLRQQQPSLKVLYMSGYTDDAIVRHGLDEATDAFLQKPFSPSTLARTVRSLLDVT